MSEVNIDRLNYLLSIAIEEAEIGWSEGGIPIGSVLELDGEIIARGHNRRIQERSAILHAEMDCLERAGRLKPEEYRRCILVSTLSPCDMCSGASLLYKIPTIIIGENSTFKGPEDYLRSRGVRLEVMESQRCIDMMKALIAERPNLWLEDIGEIA